MRLRLPSSRGGRHRKAHHSGLAAQWDRIILGRHAARREIGANTAVLATVFANLGQRPNLVLGVPIYYTTQATGCSI